MLEPNLHHNQHKQSPQLEALCAMITPAEYLELIELGNEAAGAHSMNAIAVLTTYLVAAYFGISRGQPA